MNGRGQGCGRGRGVGQGGRQGSQGRGQMQNSFGNLSENCLCPSCGEKVPHQRGIPCSGQPCPKCGTAMVRE